jgi:hypothetical protein
MPDSIKKKGKLSKKKGKSTKRKKSRRPSGRGAAILRKKMKKIDLSFDENRCAKIIDSTGERCKNHAMIGTYYCRQHQPKD